MQARTFWIAAACAGLLALPAAAQPPDDRGPRPDPELRQKILDAFDTNGDGNLDQAERQAIRRAMQEFFRPAGREGRGPDGRRGPAGGRRPDADRGPEGRRGRGDRDRADRGPEGRRGPRRPDGPPPPPRPERLFNAFDENQDAALSLDEFKALSHFMRERFAMGPPLGRPGGPRFDRDRPDGPPRDQYRRGPRDDRPPRPDSPPPPGDGPGPEEASPDEVL